MTRTSASESAEMTSTCRLRASSAACASCPWRKDREARDIPNFSMDLAEQLAATCPDERGVGPDFGANWFACHLSREGQEIPCAGWLATCGSAHPGVRLAIRDGRLAPGALQQPTGSPALHATYAEVLAKLRATMCPARQTRRGRKVTTLSSAQQRLLDRLRSGARLQWMGDKGKYQLVDGPLVRTVDPRTVDQLVQTAKIERDLVGGCVLTQNA